MKRVFFDVTLELEGPIITGSTATGNLGIDLVMARTADVAEDGAKRFYLPGTLLKGLLREAWQQFGQYAVAREWLGDPSFSTTKDGEDGEDDGPNEPDRGRLHFSDAFDRITDATKSHDLRFRTRIDRERGSVDEGALLMIESPYIPGQRYRFSARLTALLRDTESPADIESKIRAAFLWIPAVGAEKTVGFGRIHSAEVKLAMPPVRKSAPSADRLALKLTFDRPICFAKARLHPNLFESADMVPGAALKGALARALELEPHRFQNLRQHLHAVVISDFFPADANKRPVRFPVSLLRVGERNLLRDAIEYRHAPPVLHREVRFPIDWKPYEFPPDPYPWPLLPREVRVRTAIDGDQRRAKDENLFAYEMVVPPPKTPWLGFIDLSQVPATCAMELVSLLDLGVEGLGKTKAFAAVDWRPASPPAIPPLGSTVAITLQTDSLLLNPSRLAQQPLLESYREAWQQISGGKLELLHFFHRTRLHGGEYIYRRFQQTRQPRNGVNMPANGDGLYRPYLLTEPGSVFYFQVIGEASALLAKWQRTHLTIPRDTRQFYQLGDEPTSSDWEHCPCLPENGYGEIAIDLHRTHGVSLLQEVDCV